MYLVSFQGKHNIPVPYIWFKRRVQFLSYNTPNSVLHYTKQNVYTGVHRKKLNQVRIPIINFNSDINKCKDGICPLTNGQVSFCFLVLYNKSIRMTEFSLSTPHATLCRILSKTEMVNLLASILGDFEQTASSSIVQL